MIYIRSQLDEKAVSLQLYMAHSMKAQLPCYPPSCGCKSKQQDNRSFMERGISSSVNYITIMAISHNNT